MDAYIDLTVSVDQAQEFESCLLQTCVALVKEYCVSTRLPSAVLSNIICKIINVVLTWKKKSHFLFQSHEY